MSVGLVLLHFPSEHRCLRAPSGTSSINMSTKQWWNDTDKGILTMELSWNDTDRGNSVWYIGGMILTGENGVWTTGEIILTGEN